MTVWGVPGIFSKGIDSTTAFLRHLQVPMRERGERVADAELPVRNWFGARWQWREDAESLSELTHDGDSIVAHSFGCLRACEAAKLGVRYRLLFLVAPAMSRRYDFTEILDAGTVVVCLHSKSDRAITWGALLPWHPFGRAGRNGFNEPGVIHHRNDSNDHNDYFDRGQIDQWATTFLEHYSHARA
ncbi:MAG: hypothetical protein AAF515_05135 [Pseudomonadota bacterium]